MLAKIIVLAHSDFFLVSPAHFKKGDAQSVHDVVKSTFAQLEKDLSCDARLGVGSLEHVGELLLQDAIGVLGFLLFSELHRVFRFFLATAGIAVLTWAIRTALKRLVWAKNRFVEATGDPL